MKPHNTRSPEQWEIISRHIDFKGKTVLDLGCGKGDILAWAFEAGALTFGIDRDAGSLSYIRHVYSEFSIGIGRGDLNLLNMREPGAEPVIDRARHNRSEIINYLDMREPVDIVICFSVLPYLDNPEGALEWINRHSDIALIECQYAGDGPGFHFLASNDDMRDWLILWGEFQEVEPIGYTLVEGRDKKRFIWMCE